MRLEFPVFIRVLDPQLVVCEGARSKRSKRDGGKPAASTLLKPVKVNSKRAAFLRWFLEAPSGRTIPGAMAHFGISRPNVLAHWTALSREHGIGYALHNGNLKPLLPARCGPSDVFEKGD